MQQAESTRPCRLPAASCLLPTPLNGRAAIAGEAPGLGLAPEREQERPARRLGQRPRLPSTPARAAADTAAIRRSTTADVAGNGRKATSCPTSTFGIPSGRPASVRDPSRTHSASDATCSSYSPVPHRFGARCYGTLASPNCPPRAGAPGNLEKISGSPLLSVATDGRI